VTPGGTGIPPVNVCFPLYLGCSASASGSGSTFSNNLFINNGDGTSSGPTLYLASAAGSSWTLTNNVYYRSSGCFVTWKSTSRTCASTVSAVDTNGKTTLPTFVSYSAMSASNDFHLIGTDMVARNTGTSLSSNFTDDFDGTTRPQELIWDIGPYEFFGDNTPPVPGNNGLLLTSNVHGGTALTLSWTQATDPDDPQASLQYQVYRSNTNNIDTVAHILANGTIVQTWQTAISSANLTNLPQNSTQYFNVLVEDTAGNQAAYTMQAQSLCAELVMPSYLEQLRRRQQRFPRRRVPPPPRRPGTQPPPAPTPAPVPPPVVSDSPPPKPCNPIQ